MKPVKYVIIFILNQWKLGNGGKYENENRIKRATINDIKKLIKD